MAVVDRSDVSELKKIQEFVYSVPDAHFIQDPRWQNVHSNLEAEYVTCCEDGEIKIVAAVYVRPIFMGYSLLYVNRGPVAAVHSPETVLKVLEEMKPLIRKHKAFAVRFDPNWHYSDELTEAFRRAGFCVRGRGYTKRDLVMSRKTMRFLLKDRSVDELMKMFKSRTRRDINKSLRSDLTLEEGFTKEHMDVFMDILKITCDRDGITHKPRSFFESIAENFTDDEARMYLIKKDDVWLSATVSLNYAGRMFYYHAGSTNEMRNLCPNARMQYELIKWAVEAGCHTYDMGGIVNEDPKDGLYLFKSGYCNEDEIEEYLGELDYPVSRIKYWGFIKAYTAMQKFRMWHFNRKVNNR